MAFFYLVLFVLFTYFLNALILFSASALLKLTIFYFSLVTESPIKPSDEVEALLISLSNNLPTEAL